MFRIDEFNPPAGWVTVRRDIPDDEREGLEAANAAMIWSGEGDPVPGAVRFVDTEPPL